MIVEKQCGRCAFGTDGGCLRSADVVALDLDPVNELCSVYRPVAMSLSAWDKRLITNCLGYGGVPENALKIMRKMTVADLKALFLKEGDRILRGSLHEPEKRRLTQMYVLDWEKIDDWSSKLEGER
ncbi:MAG: hypothetical protein IJT54_04160 [Candidatus Methanomethylophilaceae archaeon]|nr:hypothetical protein [Candidatus Methanomethylophilaceae archaeon]